MFARRVCARGGAGMLLVLVVRVGGTGVSDASEARCVACAQANPQPVQSSQLARRRATRTSCSVAAPMPLKHVGKRATSFAFLPARLPLTGAWTDVALCGVHREGAACACSECATPRPAGHATSLRETRRCVWTGRYGWLAPSGSCNARTPHRPTNTRKWIHLLPTELSVSCVRQVCRGGQVV